MKIRVLAGAAVAVLALAGCGSDAVEDIAGSAASAAAGEVQDQASQAVDQFTGPLCDGLGQIDESLGTLADGKVATVGAAKDQIAQAQKDLEQTAEEAGPASQVALAGVVAGLQSLAQSLGGLQDEAAVPESITQAVDGLASTVSQAEQAAGC